MIDRARANETAIPPAVSGAPAKPRPRRRWHTPRCDPKMATTRTLGTVAGIPGSRRRHSDAFRHQHPQRLGSVSGQSASNAAPGRAYSNHPARSSVPLTKPEPRTQTTLCTRITTPSLFTETPCHDGFTSTRATQSHTAAARSAAGISDASDEPCLFTDHARAGGRLGRQQSHRARAREVARREGGSDTGTESNPLLGPR